MNIKRLSEILQALNAEDQSNLRAFLQYRQIPLSLFDACIRAETAISKELLLVQLSLESRSYDSTKSKLLSTVIEWHILNRDIWVSKQVNELVEGHLLLQWGDAKAAYKLAQNVQKKAETDARLTIARLALEIKSSAAQSVFQNDATAEMLKIAQEAEDLTMQSLQNASVTSVYVQASALAEQSLLLRTNERKNQLDALIDRIQEIDQQFPKLNFHIWAYRMYGESYLYMVQGDFQATFKIMNQLWIQMIVKPYRIPIYEHRFYYFFQTYTSTAIRAEQWEKAKEATTLYQHAIDKYFGNDQRKKALAHTFTNLIEVGQSEEIKDRQLILKPLIQLFLNGKKVEQGNFDISSWELFVSADIIPILIKRAFQYGMYKECKSLLGLVSQFKLKKSNIATDLIMLKPLVKQVVHLEILQSQNILPCSDDAFIRGANQCYETFRDKKLRNSYMIEWELARLFRAIAHNAKKDLDSHFQKCIQEIQNKKSDCLYYQGLMEIFDFDTWIKSKL